VQTEEKKGSVNILSKHVCSSLKKEIGIKMESPNSPRVVRNPRTLTSRTPADNKSEGVGEMTNGRAHAMTAGSIEDVSSEGGDQLSGDLLSSTSLLYSAPSCISDFTERWITEVMRQYYMTQFGQKLPQGIGNFSVEMAGNNEIKADQDDNTQVR
jgi:hypothetical protein